MLRSQSSWLGWATFMHFKAPHVVCTWLDCQGICGHTWVRVLSVACFNMNGSHVYRRGGWGGYAKYGRACNPCQKCKCGLDVCAQRKSIKVNVRGLYMNACSPALFIYTKLGRKNLEKILQVTNEMSTSNNTCCFLTMQGDACHWIQIFDDLTYRELT